jgi:protein-S-isoprenylcysteine O-methyltransferase Ste14
MKLDTFLAFAVAGLTLLVYGLGMRWFHNRKDRTPAKTRITVSAYICAAVQLTVILLSQPVPAVCRWIGAGLYVLGMVIFWWSRAAHAGRRLAFVHSNASPSFLTQTGPYRVIRHPIYSAYLLAWLAGPIISAQPWLLLTTLWMVVLHYLAARQEERSFGASAFAQDYERYRRRTGMFLPSVIGLLGLFPPRTPEARDGARHDRFAA